MEDVVTSWIVVDRKFLPGTFFLPPCSTNYPRKDVFLEEAN